MILEDMMVGDINAAVDQLLEDDVCPSSGDHTLSSMGESNKPAVGMRFKSFEDAYKFYQEYARDVGFDTRKQAAKKCLDGREYMWRYACCNRQGFKEKFLQESEELKEKGANQLKTLKRRRITRCGCPAKVCFKFEGQFGWIVYKFVEYHNHELVSKKHKSFMRVNRKLDDVHKRFIMDCAKVNIGTTEAYNLMCEIFGGKDRVGCMLVDMRNFVRDMRAYVKDSDAQMLLNELKQKKQLSKDFFFSYDVDDDGRLVRLFWADSTSQKNYGIFGDVVAFDTTYFTNRYCMILAPFTGKDNHGRPVTFACGLLSSEDAESFCWLFAKFISCMGQSPKIIVTDQDLGMKIAVERVLSVTRHRWCMWHIMMKLSLKVPKSLHGNEQFKRELNRCVWSDLIEPGEFEVMWNDICLRYGLEDNSWLKSLFNDRHYWIPAYFRDVDLGGIIRTTSISECENSFFKRYTRCSASLIELWMKFNHALECQRMAAAKLDYADQTSSPILKTSWDIEKTAGMLFTANIFSKIQEEIVASFYSCIIDDSRIFDALEEYIVKDKSDGDFNVQYTKEDDMYICGCKLFCMKGILCRHNFFVLRNKGINHIPEMYITRRWLKSSMVEKDDDKEVIAADPQSIEMHRLSNNLMSTFFKWIKVFQGEKNKMLAFVEAIDQAGTSLALQDSLCVDSKDSNVMEDYYGSLPENIEVATPKVVKTKGSGSRLISRREKASRLKDKPLRRCARCGEMGRHDSRNCEKVKSV